MVRDNSYDLYLYIYTIIFQKKRDIFQDFKSVAKYIFIYEFAVHLDLILTKS